MTVDVVGSTTEWPRGWAVVQSTRVFDEQFGELSVEGSIDQLDAAYVLVTGAAIPEAVLRRGPVAELSPYYPIGTRDRHNLDLHIGGVPAAIAPGPGRLLRASYRVTVLHEGRLHVLRPNSSDKSKLVVDGRRVGTLEYFPGVGPAAAVWTAPVTPEAAAIGYLLATSFGTGVDLVSLLEFLVP